MRNRAGPGRTEDGASSVEYALLIAFIAAAIVIAVLAFGGAVKSTFTNTCQSYQQPTAGTANCG